MNLNLNDFLQYAETGTAPTVYSRQQAAGKPATVRKQPAVATVAPPSIPSVPPFVTPVLPLVNPKPSNPAPETQEQVLELVMYSERSFAIFGDTKPVKAQLEALFGKFNRYLKKDGVATPGFIFSIGRLDAVKKALNLQ